MNKLLLVFLIGLTTTINVYSQTAEEWFQRGEEAYQEDKFDIAINHYKKAADLGSVEACGALSFMYYYGAASTMNNGITIRRNTDMASLWAKRAGVNKNLEADNVLALISYYNGDFGKTIQILSYWKEKALYTEAKIALAISYMMNGNELTRFLGKQKAEPLLKDVYNRLRNDKPSFFYTACAILAKIEFEKKWKWTNKVTNYIEEFGVFDSDDYEFCPLSLYVFGRYFYKCAETKELSKDCIEIASKWVYTNNKYEVLFPFANEINQEYNKIK